VRSNQEPDAPIEQNTDLESSRSEEKAVRNLQKTLAALYSCLHKGKILVEMGREKFDEDWIVQDAAINTVTQLAEEAKRLPRQFREERDDIAWHQLIGMSNVLAHDYSEVDLSAVWMVLRDKFPILEKSVFSDN
jgi:uncharacterized protein with HEPN domain